MGNSESASVDAYGPPLAEDTDPAVAEVFHPGAKLVQSVTPFMHRISLKLSALLNAMQAEDVMGKTRDLSIGHEGVTNDHWQRHTQQSASLLRAERHAVFQKIRRRLVAAVSARNNETASQRNDPLRIARDLANKWTDALFAHSYCRALHALCEQGALAYPRGICAVITGTIGDPEVRKKFLACSHLSNEKAFLTASNDRELARSLCQDLAAQTKETGALLMHVSRLIDSVVDTGELGVDEARTVRPQLAERKPVLFVGRRYNPVDRAARRPARQYEHDRDQMPRPRTGNTRSPARSWRDFGGRTAGSGRWDG